MKSNSSFWSRWTTIIYTNIFTILACQCVGGYKAGGIPIGDYCADWATSGIENIRWCFLGGGLDAENCTGAKKSSDGDYYWTNAREICGGKYDVVQNR